MVLKLVAYPLNGVKAAFVDCLGNLFLGSYTFSSVRLLFERHDVHTVIKIHTKRCAAKQTAAD